MEELADEYKGKIKVAKLDVDNNKQIAGNRSERHSDIDVVQGWPGG